MDHNLYTKYLNLTGRLTLIKTLTLLEQQSYKVASLALTLLALPQLIYLAHGWMTWQGGGLYL